MTKLSNNAILEGLAQAVRHARGEVQLPTTTVYVDAVTAKLEAIRPTEEELAKAGKPKKIKLRLKTRSLKQAAAMRARKTKAGAVKRKKAALKAKAKHKTHKPHKVKEQSTPKPKKHAQPHAKAGRHAAARPARGGGGSAALPAPTGGKSAGEKAIDKVLPKRVLKLSGAPDTHPANDCVKKLYEIIDRAHNGDDAKAEELFGKLLKQCKNKAINNAAAKTLEGLTTADKPMVARIGTLIESTSPRVVMTAIDAMHRPYADTPLEPAKTERGNDPESKDISDKKDVNGKPLPRGKAKVVDWKPSP